eukprot:15314669-Alexandrium_andersonii.AAC.1
MLVSAAICPNPQSALPNMQNRFTRSNQEPRGPKVAQSLAPETPKGRAMRGEMGREEHGERALGCLGEGKQGWGIDTWGKR